MKTFRKSRLSTTREPLSAPGRVASLHTLHGKANGRFAGGISIPAAISQSAGCPPFPTVGNSAPVGAAVIEQLSAALERVTAANHPRTYKLLQSGRRRLARKLIEEACEVTVEACKRDADGMVRESADLLYHLVVLWFRSGIAPADVWREMKERADALGIAEKLPKVDNREAHTESDS